MGSKKIYVIRHGQTDFNFRNIVQGSGVDTSLNETGQAQAKAFFDYYKATAFDKVYYSGLKRTKETIQQFLNLGLPSESLTGLNEISWGNKEGYRITPDEDQYYHHMLSQWQSGNTALSIEGGESPDDVVKRMWPAVNHILAQTDEKTVLVCMHGRAIRILLCMLLQYPLRSMDTFEHTNVGLYLLDYTNSTFTIEKHNDTTHLRLS